MKRHHLSILITLVFVFILLYTGLVKINQFNLFKEEIAESPILKPISSWIAWSIPTIEICVSILLLIPLYRLPALYVTMALMIIFTGYFLITSFLYNHLPCSCGGFIETMSRKNHLLLNITLISLSLINIILVKKTNQIHVKHRF